jgi:hypothetical protein
MTPSTYFTTFILPTTLSIASIPPSNYIITSIFPTTSLPATNIITSTANASISIVAATSVITRNSTRVFGTITISTDHETITPSVFTHTPSYGATAASYSSGSLVLSSDSIPSVKNNEGPDVMMNPIIIAGIGSAVILMIIFSTSIFYFIMYVK